MIICHIYVIYAIVETLFQPDQMTTCYVFLSYFCFLPIGVACFPFLYLAFTFLVKKGDFVVLQVQGPLREECKHNRNFLERVLVVLEQQKVESVVIVTDEHYFCICGKVVYQVKLEEKFDFQLSFMGVDGIKLTSNIMQSFEDGKWKRVETMVEENVINHCMVT